MLETDERIGHISWHGKGYTAISMDRGIIPLKGETKVEGAGPRINLSAYSTIKY